MSGEDATCRGDYYERVRDNARSIVEHTAAMPGDEAIYEAVNETADGAVIYDYQCDEILRFTRNRDAAFEQIGPECIAGKETASQVNVVLAYFAYSQDLSEALHGMDKDEAHELAGHHQCTHAWKSKVAGLIPCEEWHEDKDDAEDCCKTEFICRDSEGETDSGCGHEWKAYDEGQADEDDQECPECESTTIEYL